MCKLVALTCLSIILYGSSLVLEAQTCCSGGVPLSGNLGLPISNQSSWQFSLNYDLNVLKTLKVGTEKLDERNRRRITHSVLFEAGYTFSDRFSTDIFLSWVRQERKIINPGLPDQLQHTNGIGDAVILLKYNVINKDGDVLTFGAGPKLPTGKSDINSDGILLGADLQPGSGAWDGVFWSYFSHQIEARKSMSYTITATYRQTGVNKNFRADQSYQFGRDFQAILGVGDRVLIGEILVDPSVSFRYRRASEDKIDGNALPNTGGEWVFINPVLGFSLSNNLALNLGVEFPLYAKITGTQLTPTYRINGGFYYIINKRNGDPMELKIP